MDYQPNAEPVESQELNQALALANLQRRMKSGANNFYWIAALSAINSLVTVFGGSFYFVIGLGVTLIIDGFSAGLAEELGGSPLVLGLGLMFSLVFDAIFAIFGYFAGKGQRWAFVAGMVFYTLDGILMLAFQEWIGFAFHLYFLWGIWLAFQALGKLRALQPEHSADSAFPPDIGTL